MNFLCRSAAISCVALAPFAALAQNPAPTANLAGLSAIDVLVPGVIQTGQVNGSWPLASQPCSSLLSGTVMSSFCLNRGAGSATDETAYFDDQVGSGQNGIGFMSATLASGPSYTTDQRLYLRVDQGAAGDGTVMRMALDNQASTPGGIWFGAWLTGVGGINDSALRIVGENSDASPTWTTGISLERVWNTSVSDGSTGGPSAIEIGGTHSVGILSDHPVNYSSAAVLFPSDASGRTLEGVAWWAVSSPSADDVAIGAEDLTDTPCGLCVSTSSALVGSGPAPSARSARFRRGGGLTSEVGVAFGSDPAGSPAEWRQALSGAGSVSIPLTPSGQTTSLVQGAMNGISDLSLVIDTTCATASASSEVETNAIYSAAGQLLSQSQRTLAGDGFVQFVAQSLASPAPLATVHPANTAPTSCISDAQFGDLP